MLMSSTLDRDSSSVLRSRPIGLPRYHVNEKCGPRMPPFCSHWQPAEVGPEGTRALACRSCLPFVSLPPPHSGKKGPWLAALSGVGCEDDGLLLEPDELSEQP